jgi:hypothetical protein
MGVKTDELQADSIATTLAPPTPVHADASPGVLSQAHIGHADAKPAHRVNPWEVAKPQTDKPRTERVGDKGSGGMNVLNYAKGSAELTASQKDDIKKNVVNLMPPHTKIEVIGHASKDEKDVSQARADAVAAYLTNELKVPAHQIVAVNGHGQDGNHSVEIKITTTDSYLEGEVLPGHEGDAVHKIGDGAPEKPEEGGAGTTIAHAIADVVAQVAEETILGMAAEVVGPVLMMVEYLEASKYAAEAQKRYAYLDGMKQGSGGAANLIMGHKARVSHSDVAASVNANPSGAGGTNVPYYPIGEAQWRPLLNEGCRMAVAPYNGLMQKVEEKVRQVLEKKGLAGQNMKWAFGAIADEARGKVAFKLDAAIQAEEQKLRFETTHHVPE